MAPRWQAGMGCASGLILEPHTHVYLYMDSGKSNIFRVLFSPCDPSERHRALFFTTGSGEPGTGSPVPVPVPVEQPRPEVGLEGMECPANDGAVREGAIDACLRRLNEACRVCGPLSRWAIFRTVVFVAAVRRAPPNPWCSAAWRSGSGRVWSLSSPPVPPLGVCARVGPTPRCAPSAQASRHPHPPRKLSPGGRIKGGHRVRHRGEARGDCSPPTIVTRTVKLIVRAARL
jgi:hypothetical protein